MKKIISLMLCCLIFSGCTALPGETTVPQVTIPVIETVEGPSGQEMEIIPEIMRFTVYTPNENYDGFIATEVEGEALALPDELVKAGVLTEDVQINYIKWESDNTTVTVDLSSAFRDLLNSQGSTGEHMLMGCVVNTFLSAYEAEQIYITVDGEILESGHVIYDFPMEFFE